jgi:epsilon-lactone hydrolase
MSLQAEFIRVAARLFIRPGNHPDASVAEQHARMRSYERWVPRAPAGTATVERALGAIPAVRITRPGAQAGRCILFLHGGGYVTGSSALYRHITWRFADAAEAELIAIDYRLAPQYPFPAALDDAFAAWRALLADGADPKRCMIMGDSAGGGLTLALALRLRDEGVALPAALVAISPWTDLAITGPSARPGTADPMLTAGDLHAFAAQYLNGADARQPYVSPLYGDPRGLPPTLIQVGSDEILLDDSERMRERMREAGCEVTLETWPRMPHVWHAFAPMMPEAKKAIARVGAFVRQRTA